MSPSSSRALRARALLALAAGLLLAGCSSAPSASPAASSARPGGTGAGATPTPGAPSPARSSAAPSDPATPAPTTPVPTRTSAPGPLPCTTAQLRITLGLGDGAAGSVYRPLRFRNSSSATCTLSGHPGVSYVAGDDGHQVGRPARRTGTPVHVTLRPGATAAAVLQELNAEIEDPGTCHLTRVTGLRVYPPDQRASAFLREPGRACAGGPSLLGIGPVHAGSGGR